MPVICSTSNAVPRVPRRAENHKLMISLTSPTSTISRKAHRMAVGALFFLLGLCFATWASRIPSIQQRMGISEAALGGVLLAIPLGQLVSLPLAGWLVARQGSRRVVLWGVVLYAVALLGLGWQPLAAAAVPGAIRRGR